MSDTRKACEGADTIPHWHCQGEMHECVHCGSQVQWDLVDHRFWGFAATCREKTKVETGSVSANPDITQMQTEWLGRYRLANRHIIVEDLDGWSVHVHSIDGVSPSTSYPTKELAVARLLQLLKIDAVVEPQRHPERVCIGSIETREDLR